MPKKLVFLAKIKGEIKNPFKFAKTLILIFYEKIEKQRVLKEI